MEQRTIVIHPNPPEYYQNDPCRPITGAIGVVENLQTGLEETSFSLGKSVFTIKNDDVPEFLKEGARIEIDFVLMTIKHLA